MAALAPMAGNIKKPEDLFGKPIVTSFPNLTKKYYDELLKNDQTGTATAPTIRVISGSVEAACSLGLAEGVVDLVETGGTAQAAGLGEIGTIMTTEAVLIKNPNSKHAELVETIRKRIEGYLYAKKYCMMYYNIERKNLSPATEITPGKTAPTITPLEDPNWVSVGVMVPNNDTGLVMDKLEKIGARDILVIAIANYR